MSLAAQRIRVGVVDEARPAPDTILVATVASLVAFGLVMVFSASSATAYATYHDATYYLKRQFMWLAIALVAAFFAYRCDYRMLQQGRARAARRRRCSCSRSCSSRTSASHRAERGAGSAPVRSNSNRRSSRSSRSSLSRERAHAQGRARALARAAASSRSAWSRRCWRCSSSSSRTWGRRACSCSPRRRCCSPGARGSCT